MRALPAAGTQVIPSDLEGNFSIFFRRIYFPFNAVGMPSLNNNVRNATFFISNLVCSFSLNICSVHLFPFLPSMFSAFQIQSLGFYGWFWRENAAHLLKPKAFKCTWVELGFSFSSACGGRLRERDLEKKLEARIGRAKLARGARKGHIWNWGEVG